ncbi:MAG: glycosyltransferase family 4 protein [Marmoricola sp.]
MRILIHDYAGHPFQAELSRELARRGHDVTHSWCDAYVSGKGRLVAEPGETVRFEAVSAGRRIRKTDFGRRLVQEVRIGWELARHALRVRPDVMVVSNTPVPSALVLTPVLAVWRIPWVLWHQDVQCVAIRSFAGARLSRLFLLVAAVIGWGERWCARRAAGIVVIAESFRDVHRAWATDEKTVTIPNWAPLQEIYPTERKNDWSVEHGLDDVQTILYSGTLGLKHQPALLPQLARAVADRGRPVRLVVVNQGPAEQVLREESERLGVDLLLLPFQPYDRLSEVLAAGDVLVVLLERSAGAFSVPSKTLSYLCAGRPVLGLMPAENAAAALVAAAGGLVAPPAAASVDDAAKWVVEMLSDVERRTAVNLQARAVAEQRFALDRCADRFEEVLAGAASSRRPGGVDHRAG